MRFLGTDDSVTTCDCCGRTELKSTVAIETAAGEVVHYGCVCAARALGRTTEEIKAGTAAADVEKVADQVNALALQVAFLVQATWGEDAQNALRARGCHYMAGHAANWTEHYCRHLEAALSPKRDSMKIAKLEKLNRTCAARVEAWKKALAQ